MSTPSPVYRQAIRRFQSLFAKIQKSGLKEPSAVGLATADAQGRPSCRMVLLKEADESGFVFYTNLDSRKGKQLKANPRAALCFYWEPVGMQILVEGKVEPVSEAEAEVYWETRPRQSQIGAWASLQSQFLENRRVLLARAARMAARFVGRPVPRPPHWTGFRVMPDRIEFWKRRPFRLHERELYLKQPSGWSRRFLYP